MKVVTRMLNMRYYFCRSKHCESVVAGVTRKEDGKTDGKAVIPFAVEDR